MRIFSTHPLDPDVTCDLIALGDYHVAESPTPSHIMRDSAGAEIIVVRAPIDPAIVRRATGLRALVRHGAGLDMIPVDVATETGALVANVPGANAVTVAEHVIWSALSLLRRNPAVGADLRGKGWEPARRHSVLGREISDRTIGIVGFGNIGGRIANIARNGFGMNVVATTRTPSKLPTGVTALSLPNLLKTSDVVALTCPLTPETRGLIGAIELAAMKPGAVLVNVSRGPVIDEAPLIEALSSGALAGAALDVFSTQPLPADHPFMGLDNVILTPHMAGITEESMSRMGQGVVKEVRRIISGGLPENFCNPEVEPTYRAKFG